MAFSGDVSVMGLDEVIGFLGSNGLNGVLTVASSACSLTLYFRGGRIVCPEQPLKRKSGRLDKSSLQDILARGAKISKSSGRLPPLGSKAQEGSAKQTRRRRRAGSGSTRKALPPDVLEEILNSAEELDRDALARKVHDAIQQVLLWSPARFEFQPGALPRPVARDVVAGRYLSFDPNSLLMEAARRRDHSKRLAGRDAPQSSTEAAVQRDLHGNLAGIGLAAVLQSLNAQGRTGTLTVFTHDREENLYFQHGEAFVLILEREDDQFAKEFLGESLVDQVSLSSDLARCDQTGSLSEEDLSAAELRAVKDQFLDLLFWDEAEFVFSNDQLPSEFENPGEGARKIALRTSRFLMEAIQRLTEWDKVRQVVGGSDAVLEFVDIESKMAKTATLSPRGLQVLMLVDGRLKFAEVVRLSGLEHLEAGRLIQDLVESGQIQAVKAAR